MKPLIKLDNLSLGYDKTKVLEGLTLEINDGDFVCVVGPNGSGKTTFIRGLLGLIKPMSGKIAFDGLTSNTIGYMPQETSVDPVFPATVKEIVLSGCLNQSKSRFFYSNDAVKKAMRSLSLLGITRLSKRSFAELSGGQRQKVLLARALAASSKLLILDEPSNNLDSTSKQDLYTLVRELNEKHGITIILVTHDLDHDNLIGNKILSLHKPKYFYGTTEEFVRKVHHE